MLEGNKVQTITSREMKALELNSEYYGVSRLQLMENAGKSIADEISARFNPETSRILILCGLGGNGGDGFVAARHLSNKGFKVTVMIAGKAANIRDECTRKNLEALRNIRDKIEILEIYDSSIIPNLNADVIVDALLGIGLKGHLRPPILQFVKKINETKAFKVAVDVPTGIDSDTGQVLEEAVKADLTITFHKAKPGLLVAKEHVGEITVKDIGLPVEFEYYTGPGDVSAVMKPRPSNSHKGDFGRLLIIGGSETYSGAPALVALAALRTGVDLTYIAAPERTAYSISSFSPNLITIKLEGNNLNLKNVPVIEREMEKATAIVLGPGLGLHPETTSAVKEIIKISEKLKKPLILDADGLKAFAEEKRKLGTPSVLTPHAGEFKLLSGHELPQELKERAEKVRKTAAELNATILLKGHVDVISDGERLKFNFTGNPAMTVGGTGDVLSGIVGALLAQGITPFEAAVAGAFINGAAGDFAYNEKGFHIVSTDLLKWIPKVFNDPMSHLEVKDKVSKI